MTSGSEDLPAEGMERPDADHSGDDPERRECRVGSFRKFLCGAFVEGDRRDVLRVDATVDQPRDPGDERSRLAAARRRDAEHRTGWRRCCGTLVGRQPRETLEDGRMGHRPTIARPSYRPLNLRAREPFEREMVTPVNEPVPKGGATAHRGVR
jgi:hypothetical protein